MRSAADRVESRLTALLAPPGVALVPLRVDGQRMGFLTPDRAQRLERFDCFRWRADALEIAGERRGRDAAMAEVARTLAAEGLLTAWRDERYAVRTRFDASPLFEVERAAARYLGIHTYAAHVNGLVRTSEGVRMWVARRSATKAIDPAMLDNLVGGGIAAGATVVDAVVKESWEEAGIGAETARQAFRAAELTVFRQQPDGIQHETIYAHDLWLPPDWTPRNQDGEAVEHRLLTLAAAADIVGNETAPDVMTADASLVTLDCLVRLGAMEARASFARLARARVDVDGR
jgi:8-oxo-dGTP pyrophosphatase MutT (NUDIX family)